MDRRAFIQGITVAFLAPLAAEAQQAAEKMPRIGFLANVRSPAVDGFLQGLRELGYIEDRNIVIEWRLAQGRFDRLPELAADLVRLNVDAIIAPAPPYVRAASQATTTIPIVFALVADPLADGFVVSLARPGVTSLGSPASPLSCTGSDSNYSGRLSQASPASACARIPREPSRG